MTLSEIAQIRLINQQVSTSVMKSPKEVVSWMGAMQAQDYAMSKWAVGVRLPKAQEQDIENAVSKGDIIRTHLLRPTWHLVAGEDLQWMLTLTAPQVKNLMKSRDKQLELTDELYAQSHKIIEKVLSKGEHLTREELIAALEKENIKTNDNRSSHFLMRAELDTIICSGAIKNNKQTYSLLAERVPNHQPVSKEEALAKLAHKYFFSHGPATLQDFAWWSGLTQKDARTGLEAIKQTLISITTDAKEYWFKDPGNKNIKQEKDTVHLLPAFDEFIISYKDRSATLTDDNHKKAVSTNGIFRPTIVVNSLVVGLWKKTIQKNKAHIETEFFHKQKPGIIESIEQAIAEYGHFLNKEIERV